MENRISNIKFIIASLVMASLVTSCGDGVGDTDGGNAADRAQEVSGLTNPRGNSNFTLRIVDNRISVGEITGFEATVVDSDGVPVDNQPISCNTEGGLALIEPSDGSTGPSFQYTNSNGSISGKVGGLAPGSYMLECFFGSQLTNSANGQVVVTGTIPAGFEGFPNASGQTLGGGGGFPETDDEDVSVFLSDIQIQTLGDGDGIDIFRSQCQTGEDENGNPIFEDEEFGPDNFSFKINNNTQNSTLELRSVTYTVTQLGLGSSNSVGINGVIAPGGVSGDIQVPLTDLSLGGVSQNNKFIAGTTTLAVAGVHDLLIEVRVTLNDAQTGENNTVTVDATETVTFGTFDNCPE